jgi:RNA polymerase sigma factor (sigma-70 family)
VKEQCIEDLLRREAPQVLGALVRRYGNFDLAEDAVQDALIAAAGQWRTDRIPDNPRGWLIRVAARRLTDLLRAEQARRRREDTVARWVVAAQRPADGEVSRAAGDDDSLTLLLMCCHPSLPAASQVALTLRAVGGLTTTEIARAFLVPEATITRRISRAKQRIRESGMPFRLPPPVERDERAAAVMHVLYLIFNEGYVSTAGPHLHRADLAAEAIRLARLLHRALPDDPEVAGLLALMLLTDARRPARTDRNGGLIALAEQDRSLWITGQIAEGVALITTALPRGPTGPYQLQAAIAAVHDEAAGAADTDWPQILALYEVLLRTGDNPVITMNHAVALAMVHGPRSGLDRLAELERTGALPAALTERDHRLPSVRGHLLELAGEHAAAAAAYRLAAGRTASLQQQRYLLGRAASVG